MMDKRVIEEIRRRVGLPLSVEDEEIERIASGTFTEAVVTLGFAIGDAKRAFMGALPKWGGE